MNLQQQQRRPQLQGVLWGTVGCSQLSFLVLVMEEGLMERKVRGESSATLSGTRTHCPFGELFSLIYLFLVSKE